MYGNMLVLYDGLFLITLGPDCKNICLLFRLVFYTYFSDILCRGFFND